MSRIPTMVFAATALVCALFIVLTATPVAADGTCAITHCKKCNAILTAICEECDTGYTQGNMGQSCEPIATGGNGEDGDGNATTATPTTRKPVSTTSAPGAPCLVADCQTCYKTDNTKCLTCDVGLTVSLDRARCSRVEGFNGAAGAATAGAMAVAVAATALASLAALAL